MPSSCHSSALLLAVASLFVAACATNSGDKGGDARGITSVKIESSDRWAIEDAISDAFIDDGFRYSRTVGDTITFHKKGERNAVFAYSDLSNSNDIWIEANVIIVPMGPDAHRVRCDVDISQLDAGMGYDRRKPMFVGKVGYVALLKKAKKKIEKG